MKKKGSDKASKGSGNDEEKVTLQQIFKRVKRLSPETQEKFAKVLEKIEELDPRYIMFLLAALKGDDVDDLFVSDQISNVFDMIAVFDKGTKDFKPKGDYGYEMSNPVMVRGITAGYDFLDSLECDDGDPIRYQRHGAFDARSYNLPEPMDGYHIYNKKTGEEIAFMYIYPYSHETSKEPPEGFRFKKNYKRK